MNIKYNNKYTLVKTSSSIRDDGFSGSYKL